MSDLSKKLLGSPVIELAHKDATIDTKSLCGSKHEAWVWVTDEDEDGVPNALEDSIIIGFKGLDSSGAGCIDAIIQGGLIYITDADEWNSVVSEGLDILQQKYDDCQGVADCTWKGVQLGAYGTAYGFTYVAQPIIDYGIVKPTTWVASTASSGWKKVKSWFAEEEQFRSEIDTNITNCNILSPDGATTGTLFHNQNGDEHRIKITVNKLYQGITSKVHEVEMAGGTTYKKIDNALWFEPVYKKLKLTGPGTYTIQVESLAANQDCGTPELNFTTSVEVSPSANNQEETTTTEDTVGSLVASTGVRPLYVYGGIILFGGLLLSKLYAPRK